MHMYDNDASPHVTTTILEVHSDEVWNVAWSHDGTRLASASRDRLLLFGALGLAELKCIISRANLVPTARG
jgi:WD repeat-containing protein 26